MRCAPARFQVFCLALVGSAIRITNKEFDVQRGVDFEVTWTDAGGDRVDIDLHESPIRAFVEALSRGRTRFVKEESRTVLISEDIEPRLYCFKVTDWPSGQTGYSEAFFFNGTGEATTASPSSDPTPTSTTSSTATAPWESETITPGDNEGDRNRPYIKRSTWINPWIIGISAVGGAVCIAVAICCVMGHVRGKKKKKRLAAAAEAETVDGNARAAAGQEGPESGQVEGAGETVSEKATEVVRSHGVTEYYASAALGGRQ